MVLDSAQWCHLIYVVDPISGKKLWLSSYCSYLNFLTHIVVWIWLFSLCISLHGNAFSAHSLQSIGFVGPGLCLIGLATAKSPSVGSAWLTLAFGLKSFSHSGFLVNLQVSIFSHLKTFFFFFWLEVLFSNIMFFSFVITGDCTTVLWCFAWYAFILW